MQGEVRFTVLGPVRAWRGETELDLGHPKQRAVLAALLVREGTQVTVEELTDGLWGDEAPATSAQVIRSYVYQLRLILGRDGTGFVVIRDGQVLLLWRHRFITDSWGWEVPAGWAEPGEDPARAVMREIEVETGFRPALVRPMTGYNALSGISDMRFTAFVASGAQRVGPPADQGESSRVEWVQLAEVPKLAIAGQIQDGPSLTALMYYLAVGRQS